MPTISYQSHQGNQAITMQDFCIPKAPPIHPQRHHSGLLKVTTKIVSAKVIAAAEIIIVITIIYTIVSNRFSEA